MFKNLTQLVEELNVLQRKANSINERINNEKDIAIKEILEKELNNITKSIEVLKCTEFCTKEFYSDKIRRMEFDAKHPWGQ